MTDARTQTWGAVIRNAVLAGMIELHVSIPAYVEAYDAAKQTVDVVPLLMFPVKDPTGKITMQALPKRAGVPVQFDGGGGLRTTYPIKPGDFVTLLCADRSTDVWEGSASTTPVDPGVGNSHSLADVVAIPGRRALSKPWAGADTAAITIGTDGGSFQGAGLGHALSTYLGQLKTWLDALTLPVSGATAGPPAVASPAVPTVESATVKVSP